MGKYLGLLHYGGQVGSCLCLGRRIERFQNNKLVAGLQHRNHLLSVGWRVLPPIHKYCAECCSIYLLLVLFDFSQVTLIQKWISQLFSRRNFHVWLEFVDQLRKCFVFHGRKGNPTFEKKICTFLFESFDLNVWSTIDVCIDALGQSFGWWGATVWGN